MNNNDPGDYGYPADFMIFRKTTSMPAPTQYFVFIDESSATIDNAHFKIALDTTYSTAVVDNPAAYHGGSGNTSFADGHAASHHWHANPVTDINPDGIWLMQHGSQPADGSAWPPRSFQIETRFRAVISPRWRLRPAGEPHKLPRWR